jgi:hypothetical protein
MKTKAIAFFFGDLFVTAHIIFAGIINDFGGFMLKVVATLIIGAAGGIAGMMAKDAYPLVKKYFKSLFK